MVPSPHLHSFFENKLNRVKSFFNESDRENINRENISTYLPAICDYFHIDEDQFWSNVEAGFFVDDSTEYLICFSCGIKFSHWDKMDFPAFDHALQSPSCILVNGMYGAEFVEEVHNIIKKEDIEDASEPGQCTCDKSTIHEFITNTHGVDERVYTNL